MLIIFAKIILWGSVLGMVAIAIMKMPILRELPLEGEVEKKKSFSFFLKKIKGKAVFPGLFFRKNFSLIKSKFSKRESLKEEKPEFSDDYWEKIRKGQ